MICIVYDYKSFALFDDITSGFKQITYENKLISVECRVDKNKFNFLTNLIETNFKCFLAGLNVVSIDATLFVQKKTFK